MDPYKGTSEETVAQVSYKVVVTCLQLFVHLQKESFHGSTSISLISTKVQNCSFGDSTYVPNFILELVSGI